MRKMILVVLLENYLFIQLLCQQENFVLHLMQN